MNILKILAYVLGTLLFNIFTYFMWLWVAVGVAGMYITSSPDPVEGFAVLGIGLIFGMVGFWVAVGLMPFNYFLIEYVVRHSSLKRIVPTADRWIWFILALALPLAGVFGLVGRLLRFIYE